MDRGVYQFGSPPCQLRFYLSLNLLWLALVVASLGKRTMLFSLNGYEDFARKTMLYGDA